MQLVVWVAFVATSALAVTAAFTWRALSEARTDLSRAEALLRQVSAHSSDLLSAEGRAATALALNRAIHLSDEALDRLRGSMAVDVLEAVPFATDQRSGAILLASDARTACLTAQKLLLAYDSLSVSTKLSGGKIPLGNLAAMRSKVESAAESMRSIVRSPTGLWPNLASDRRSFNELASRAAGQLHLASDSLTAAGSFMGANGPRTYLVVGENNSEMRDQGMPLNYAEVTFDKGRIRVGEAEPIYRLVLHKPVSATIPAGTKEIFGSLEPTQYWQGVNATADFQWSAPVMSAMYESATGKRVDGIIGIDVHAIAGILSVIGPVSVPALGEEISSHTIAGILLHDLYAGQPNDATSTAPTFEAAAATAVLHALTQSFGTDVVALGNILAKEASGRHLALWSEHESEESVFDKVDLAGNPASHDPQRTFHVAVENATATKLDWYVQPRVVMDIHVTSLGTAVVKVKVGITNLAPSGTQSSELVGPDGINSFLPGEYVTRVYFWGPSGSVQPGSVAESGLRLNQQPAKVEPGRTGTVTFSTIMPDAVKDGKLSVRLVPQGRIDPVTWDVSIGGGGWKVGGPSRFHVALDSTTTISWQLTR